MGLQTGIESLARRDRSYPPTSLVCGMAQPNPVTGADMKPAAANRLKTGMLGGDGQIASVVTAPCGAGRGPERADAGGSARTHCRNCDAAHAGAEPRAQR